ncbi:MAG: TonB-dependent receptor [Bacteroidales bacterium]|nr:TonB-dependent receptor [Bacteroidales bacterium]
MKTKLLLAVIALFVPLAAFAFRGDIKGSVRDASGANVGYATVALYQQDSTLVKGSTTADDGSFILAGVKEGDYRLEISIIGYKTVVKAVKVTSDEPIQLDAITLEDDAQALNAAMISEHKRVIEVKVDKIVMNVAEAVTTQGSTAKDIIRKAPGVAVDKDGNVTLNGKAVAVWIDDRPSYLSGRDLASLLTATDGTTIDKIEIIAHPSAKYDAEGSGGIINIKTKKAITGGLNGSVNFAYGGMGYKHPTFNSYYCSDAQGGLTLSYRTEKISTNFNYSGFYMNSKMATQSDSYIQSVTQKTYSLMNDKYLSNKFKLSLDGFINKKNVLGFILTARPSSMVDFALPKTSFTDTYIDGKHAYHQTIQSTDKNPNNLNVGINLNYTHTFDEAKGQELTINADYNNNASNSSSSQESPYTVIDHSFPALDPIKMQGTGKNNINILSAKADYQQTILSKGMLEAGAKFSCTMTDNVSTYKDFIGGVWKPNPAKSSDFYYRENIAAAYASVSYMFNEHWTAKLGLRAEGTFTKGNWRSSGEQTKNNYVNVFPTVFGSYIASPEFIYSLSYTYRISRPSYWNMNPQLTYIDATTYTMGNPYLKPSFSHQLTFMMNLKTHFSIAVFGGFDKDVENQVVSNPEGTLEKKITFENVGNRVSAGISFSMSEFPIFKWWLVNVNLVDMFMRNTTPTSASNQNFASGMLTFNFLLPKDWSIEAGARMMTPIDMVYMKLENLSWMCWFGVKKTFLDNRLILALNVEDPFNSSLMKISAYDTAGNKLYSISTADSARMARLSISFRFGKATTPTKKRNVGNLDESSRIGGGSGGGISMPSM